MTCAHCGEPLDLAAKCAGVDTCAGCALASGELEVAPMIPVTRLSREVLGEMAGRKAMPGAATPKLRPVAPERETSRWARQADVGERDEPGEAA